MATGYVAPIANFVQTTLNGSITDSQTTITLNSTSNLQAPGYVVIDRTDSAGTATPNAREVVSYTGISGNDLTGCTRGADNSTGRSHSSGAIVETMPTVGMWNSLTTIVLTGFDSNGYLRAINSPVSISIGRFQNIDVASGVSINHGRFIQIDVSSIASIARGHISNLVGSTVTVLTHLNASGASVIGIPISGYFHSTGDGTFNSNQVGYTKMAELSTFNATEADVQFQLPAGRVEGLFMRIGTNTLNGVTSVSFRINGADVGPGVTIGAGATGNFSQRSTASIAENDLCDLKWAIAGNSGSVLPKSVLILTRLI